MHKKILIVVALAALLAAACASYAFAAGFSDVQGHWAESEINKWAEKGLAGGYSDGTFRPNGEVTRAEFVALTNRAFGIEKKDAPAGFSDVEPGKWYYNDVSAAKAAGYIGGYSDNTFKPGKTITRQEVASILVRLLNLKPAKEDIKTFKDAAQIPQWSSGSIGAVVKSNLMSGFPDGTFKPLKSITRAEAVVSLDRALEYMPEPAAEKPEPAVKSAVKGTVTLDGSAVENARIRIFAANSYKVLKEAYTGSKGGFTIELDPGKYDITASTGGEVAYASDVEISENSATTVDLSLQPAAIISGELQDKNGNAVENAVIVFTTNPSFITSTGDGGKYTAAVLPNRTYTVRAYEPGKEDEEPVVIADDLEAASAGKQSVKVLKAPFAVKGGSGFGGGGGVTGPVEDNEPPVVNSVTFVVNGNPETVYPKDDNKFEVDLTGEQYDDESTFTALTVNASEDAKKATVTLLGITRTMTFEDGRASSTVSELLSGTAGSGSSGITLRGLKTILQLTGNIINIEVTDTNRNSTTVEVKVLI